MNELDQGNYTLEVITNVDTVRKAATERNNKTYSILNSSFMICM